MTHAVPTSFDKPTPTRDGFGAGLHRVGREDPRVVALDADLAESTRSKWFGDAFPDRFFQMGIAEQDMLTTAAGLAASGLVPFASTFAIFTERAFEIMRNAIARPNLNAKLVGSHGGVMTGEDGSSAHAIEDVAIYRALPNVRVIVPADANQAVHAVAAMASTPGPFYMKCTRAKVPIVHPPDHGFSVGRWTALRDGTDATIAANGPLVAVALAAAATLAAEGVSVRVLDASTVKPVDRDALLAAARETGHVVTAEDHSAIGGLGSAVCETLAEGQPVPVRRVGVPDRYLESGTPDELYAVSGFTASGLAEAVRAVRKVP